MRNSLLCVVIACLFVVFAGAAFSREEHREPARFYIPWSPEQFIGDLDIDVPQLLRASAQVDTYHVVCYDFDYTDWQGWTRVDNTAQVDTFWHVEDYLEPELAGLPGPLEGEKSMWCGAPPAPYDYLCHWDDAPGYGNGWEQYLTSKVFPYTGSVTFSYKGHFDSESDFDYTVVEYEDTDGWIELYAYDGVVDTVAEHHFYLTRVATKLRFRFVSDGAWSDEDGLWVTDGAAHIDSITIADDGGVINYEDFESAPDRAKQSGIWFARPAEPFGMYSGLRTSLQDKDPCSSNFSSQVVFFIGSTEESADYPGLYVTPRCLGADGIEAPCQDEMVVSPVVDMRRYSTGRNEMQDADIPPGKLADLGGVHFRYTVYIDNPTPNLVFYNWAVRSIIDGCPGHWDRLGSSIAPMSQKEYDFVTWNIGSLVDSDSIQVYLRIVDMCDTWYLFYGDCAEHTPAPWFDNVRIVRFDASGPQFSLRRLDLFQDNFPGDQNDIESYVRADAANDVRWNDSPVIDPGDSIVISCWSNLGGGIRYSWLGPDSLPEVYLHVRCPYVGCGDPPKPDLSGPALEGTYGKFEGTDGVWTLIRAEEARRGIAVMEDGYMFDLNDSLFTRGYVIEYYFSANDNAGDSGTLPANAQSDLVLFEFTCLPTLCSDILYVDDFDGRGTHEGIVQNYFDHAFKEVFISPQERPDRYDVNDPSVCVSNGPGSRAKPYHMTTAYSTVIWDSGNLPCCTISDGTMDSDKSNDCQLLLDWIDTADHDVNLWVLGDEVAEDLHNSSASQAHVLMSSTCGVMFMENSYYDVSGLMSPKVKGLPPGPFYHQLVADSFCVYGFCPLINDFDCLGETANGWPCLEYGNCFCNEQWDGSGYYAGIASQSATPAGHTFRSVWCGFSYMYVRDCQIDFPIARFELLEDVLQFFQFVTGDIVGGDDLPSYVYSLSQNYPNPFNPTTAIRFSLREKGRVGLRIYNAAGQLVRTLVDEVRDAGMYTEPWDGRNDRGGRVSSNVYFYRMESKDFSQTRKMILLR